jgi:hypothetical protein
MRERANNGFFPLPPSPPRALSYTHPIPASLSHPPCGGATLRLERLALSLELLEFNNIRKKKIK